MANPLPVGALPTLFDQLAGDYERRAVDYDGDVPSIAEQRGAARVRRAATEEPLSCYANHYLQWRRSESLHRLG